ncbi:MAG: hypothetical protein LUG99_11935 [Lachnospiraceae bacterium]|nr:hypothetical protein [Lachnospiraceae bacterium]
MKDMKRPMTTAEYFDLICGNLRKKNRMPDDMLDYALAAFSPVPILTYEFDIRNNLDYGGSEGIYLDIAIEVCEHGKRVCRSLGTFKTLQTSPEAMRTMAQLLADFILEERAYVNSHLDDFTWTGADVYAVREDGTRTGWGYSCCSMEAAIKRKDELLGKYSIVVIRDNASRKEKHYLSGGNVGLD